MRGGQLVKWFQFKDSEMGESFNYNQLGVTRLTRGVFTLHYRYSEVFRWKYERHEMRGAGMKGFD